VIISAYEKILTNHTHTHTRTHKHTHTQDIFLAHYRILDK